MEQQSFSLYELNSTIKKLLKEIFFYHLMLETTIYIEHIIRQYYLGTKYIDNCYC